MNKTDSLVFMKHVMMQLQRTLCAEKFAFWRTDAHRHS